MGEKKMKEIYNFSAFNNFAPSGITQALKEINKKQKTPVVVCVGSDLVLGDCLGPIVGSSLKQLGARCFVYGTLNAPITAKEINYLNSYFKGVHQNSFVIAIDAAVGLKDEIGLISIVDGGLKPGLGVNKKLPTVGDVGIMGIVAEKSAQNKQLYNATRLNLVYKMAKIVEEGVFNYLCEFDSSIRQII